MGALTFVKLLNTSELWEKGIGGNLSELTRYGSNFTKVEQTLYSYPDNFSFCQFMGSKPGAQ